MEYRVDRKAADKYSIELDSDNYQAKMAKIEHFLKENARLNRQVQASLSIEFSSRQPVTKRTLGNSKESLDEGNIDATDV